MICWTLHFDFIGLPKLFLILSYSNLDPMQVASCLLLKTPCYCWLRLSFFMLIFISTSHHALKETMNINHIILLTPSSFEYKQKQLVDVFGSNF